MCQVGVMGGKGEPGLPNPHPWERALGVGTPSCPCCHTEVTGGQFLQREPPWMSPWNVLEVTGTAQPVLVSPQ